MNAQSEQVTAAARVAYRTVQIDGLDIFYREAGPKDAHRVMESNEAKGKMVVVL